VTTPLELSTRQGDNGRPVLTAVGEVDMSNAAAFRDALTQAGMDEIDFTVDLTGVVYLDSAGLTALLPYAPRIRIIATGILAPVLAVSGLDPVTTVVTPLPPRPARRPQPAAGGQMARRPGVPADLAGGWRGGRRTRRADQQGTGGTGGQITPATTRLDRTASHTGTGAACTSCPLCSSYSSSARP
jgi:anti-sigma B factor antagonist